MKKSVLSFFIVLTVLVLFVSCETTSQNGSSNTTNYKKLIGNSYSVDCYSTKYDKTVNITSNDTVVICVTMDDFSWSRPIEEKLQKYFNDKGIKTLLSTDFVDYKQMFDEMEKLNLNNNLVVTVGNEGKYSTYQYGGGISKISFDVEYQKITTSVSTVIKMVVDINGTNNDLENFIKTKEKIIDYSSKKIVEEYMKYVTDYTEK